MFEGRCDLLDVLGLQVVLGAAGIELGVGIDEQYLPLAARWFVRVGKIAGAVGPQDEQAGGDARAIEQVGRQADYRLDEVFSEPF